MCVSPSTCQVADGYALPTGCIASGRGCFGKAGGHQYHPYLKAGVQLLGFDWLFAGGSASTEQVSFERAGRRPGPRRAGAAPAAHSAQRRGDRAQGAPSGGAAVVVCSSVTLPPCIYCKQ